MGKSWSQRSQCHQWLSMVSFVDCSVPFIANFVSSGGGMRFPIIFRLIVCTLEQLGKALEAVLEYVSLSECMRHPKISLGSLRKKNNKCNQHRKFAANYSGNCWNLLIQGISCTRTVGYAPAHLDMEADITEYVGFRTRHKVQRLQSFNAGAERDVWTCENSSTTHNILDLTWAVFIICFITCS